MPETGQSWSVLVFCYNEAGTVKQVAESVLDFFHKIHCDDHEIIIVDDGSTDGSAAIIDTFAKEHPSVRVIRHEKNRGIGQALLSGYFAATKENITAVPADAQFDVNELSAFPEVEKGTFVSFFRKENTVYSLTRNILSWFNKMVNRVFLGIKLRDVNWVKIFKREELVQLDLKMKSSLVESEICSKLLIRNNKVIETHSVYHRRRSGVSKGAGGKVLRQAMAETLKLIFIISLYRFKKFPA
ncbi:MAG TPA: glycosyltransferase family 2 protein [Bacteroidia bacterium]|nr:glycosyltransferase family 2 protein [Bacteroidia bacterium]